MPEFIYKRDNDSDSDNYGVFVASSIPKVKVKRRNGDEQDKDAVLPAKIYVAKPLAEGVNHITLSIPETAAPLPNLKKKGK